MTLWTAPRAAPAPLSWVWPHAAHPTCNLGPGRPEDQLQSPPPAAPGVLLPPPTATGMAALLRSVPVAGVWLRQQVGALHPLLEHSHGTAGAGSSTGHGAWKTLLCSVTEQCRMIDFPDRCWPQPGNSPWPRSPRLWPRMGLFRARQLNNRRLPWVWALAGLSAVPWASCDAQCHSWKEVMIHPCGRRRMCIYTQR